MSVVHRGSHPRSNDRCCSVGRWLGTGVSAVALGLAVYAGQAVAGAEAGDGNTHTAGRAAGEGPSGQSSKRSVAPRWGTDSSAFVAQVRVPTRTPSTGPPRRAPRLVGSVANHPAPRQIHADSAHDVVRYRNIAYGASPKEKLDVYAPPGAVDAPMILMVHGGGWSFGDKTNRGLIRNKVNHFVPDGALVISANYPMLPSQAPDGQAAAVAAAISYVQNHAAEWGGDPENLVIMGHSAGGHLVALVSADSDRYPDLRPWRGTVVLDSAALDLVARMENRPPPLFRRAFGNDPAYWESVSPLVALQGSTEPILLVCASRRSDSCPQAQAYATAASSFGTDVRVLPQSLTHRQINVTLGRPGEYTDAVDEFLRVAWKPEAPTMA